MLRVETKKQIARLNAKIPFNSNINHIKDEEVFKGENGVSECSGIINTLKFTLSLFRRKNRW